MKADAAMTNTGPGRWPARSSAASTKRRLSGRSSGARSWRPGRLPALTQAEVAKRLGVSQA